MDTFSLPRIPLTNSELKIPKDTKEHAHGMSYKRPIQSQFSPRKRPDILSKEVHLPALVNAADMAGVREPEPLPYHRDLTFMSDLYDTDLEEENENEEVDSASLRTSVCQKSYERLCDHLRVPPQTEVLENLSEKKISLRHRELGPTVAQTLAAALLENKIVEMLDLQGNRITEEGSVYIHLMLRDNNTITHLNLSHNKLGLSGAAAVADILKDNMYIAELNLAGNDFGEKSAKCLSDGLIRNCGVRVLNLSHNEFRENGMLHISEAFEENDTVERLDLSWNHIRCKGAVTLCKGLLVNRGIRDLDVSWNGFGYEGALALGELMKRNKTLRKLNSGNNRINWQGAIFLAGALKKSATLETLMLCNNPLTTTGCMDLIEAAASPACGLRMLDLTGVQVIDDFEYVATDIKRRRPFECKHGGVVGTHDVLGERQGKRLTPMQRIVAHIRNNATRAKELFRDFDKNVGNKLDHEDFAARLRKAGIQIYRWEIPQLIEQIEGHTHDNKRDEGNVNYKKLALSLREQIYMERMEKIKFRQEEKRLKRYHKMLLNPKLKAIEDGEVLNKMTPLTASQTASGSLSMRSSRPGSVANLHQLTSIEKAPSQNPAAVGTLHKVTFKLMQFRNGESLPPIANNSFKNQTHKMMSMSGGLGDSGATSKKKKKKNKKRKN